MNAFVVMFQHGIELVHEAERKAKVAKKPKTMLSKLKAATTMVLSQLRLAASPGPGVARLGFLSGVKDRQQTGADDRGKHAKLRPCVYIFYFPGIRRYA